jgi:hypothetical protein
MSEYNDDEDDEEKLVKYIKTDYYYLDKNTGIKIYLKKRIFNEKIPNSKMILIKNGYDHLNVCYFNLLFYKPELIVELLNDIDLIFSKIPDSEEKVFQLLSINSLKEKPLNPYSLRFVFLLLFISSPEFRNSIKDKCNEVVWFLAQAYLYSHFFAFFHSGSFMIENFESFVFSTMEAMALCEYSYMISCINQFYIERDAKVTFNDCGQYLGLDVGPTINELLTLKNEKTNFFNFQVIRDQFEKAQTLARDDFLQMIQKVKSESLIIFSKLIKNIHENLTISHIMGYMQGLRDESMITEKKIQKKIQIENSKKEKKKMQQQNQEFENSKKHQKYNSEIIEDYEEEENILL